MPLTKRQIILRSIFFFFLAGLFEIGGGYLVWQWLRADFGFLIGVLGGFFLFLYGVIPTFQPAPFSRVYAAYGGVFIVMSILWGWLVDLITPDIFDIIGGLIALGGAFVIMYGPRGKK